MDLRFPYSPAEVAKVRMVQFGILSPDEIVILLPTPPHQFFFILSDSVLILRGRSWVNNALHLYEVGLL